MNSYSFKTKDEQRYTMKTDANYDAVAKCVRQVNMESMGDDTKSSLQRVCSLLKEDGYEVHYNYAFHDFGVSTEY